MKPSPRRPTAFLAAAAFAAIIGTSCVSPPPEIPVAEPSRISAADRGFSPTGSPEHREMELVLSVPEAQAVRSWSVRIVSGTVTVKEFAGGGDALPARITWNGRTDQGKIWPEGLYYAFLSVDYGEAFVPSRGAWTTFYLVSSPPELVVESSPAFFTPQGLSMAEPVTISLKSASEHAAIASWSMDIIDPRGELVKSHTGESDAAQTAWDGQTFGGAFVEPSKVYKVIAKSWDEYGNSATSVIGIPVLAQPNAPEASAIKALAPGFSPTGDPSRRVMNLGLSIGNKEALKSWAVEIAAGSVVVKRIEGAAPSIPASVSWDGRSESGSLWPEGEYYPILTVDYGQAFNPVRIMGEKFLLVSSPPTVALKTSPELFTPKGDGMEAPVKISLEAASKRAKMASWSVTVLDSKGFPVRTFDGSGASGNLVWDGVLVSRAYAEPGQSYALRAVAKDEYGNSGEARIIVPVKSLPEAEPSIIAGEERGFSPNAGTGKIEFSIKIGSPDALRSWAIEISGASGIKRRFTGGAGSIPTGIAWDGRDEKGAVSPEGAYVATLAVDYGRSFKPSSAQSKEILLVSSPPRARLSLAPEAFVPQGGSVAGPVAILLEASSSLAKIESWSIDIRDADGKTVKAFNGTWPANQAVWNGLTQAGAPVLPASTYMAVAEVKDEFGNTAPASARIPVRDIPPAPEPSFVEPRITAFSPSAQVKGKPSSIGFIMNVGNTAELKFWKMTISHAERGAQKVFEGGPQDLVSNIVWDGLSSGGKPAPDGIYSASLSLDYGKVFKPGSAKSRSTFILQTAAPEAELSLDRNTLVPKNGSFEAPVALSLNSSSRYVDMESWSIVIKDRDEDIVWQWSGQGSAASVAWNGGISGGGRAEPASTYTVHAEVRDSIGNIGGARAIIEIADLPPVPGENSITPAMAGFSPNGDGAFESIDLKMEVANRESMSSWRVAIKDLSGRAIRTFMGDRESLRDSLNWGGTDDSGILAPEGAYEAELFIDYGAVYRSASVKSRKFVVALSPPTGEIKVAPSSPIPDEKGFVSPALISVEAKSNFARLASCEVRILDRSGATIAAFDSPWPLRQVAWDGIHADGKLAEPQAPYEIVATVRDEFGIAARLGASLRVASLPGATETSSVSPLSRGFSPAAKSVMRFGLAFGNQNLIRAWKLDIEREDKTVRMSWDGEGRGFPDSFSWDGRLQDGTLAPDGRYLASLSIQYGRAYAPARIESAPFLLVANPPSGSLKIDPGLFSPDGDGVDETAVISLEASSRYAEIGEYSIDIGDPGGNLFQTFKGSWPAAPIIWDGRNAAGELVESAEEYPVVARVRDEFGNTLELKSQIDVDILVMKEGDGYKIRIASIVFKSFTADYTDVPPDRAAANLETLSRLAEKLKKYPDYQIRLVGHAVMVNWDDPVLGKAEQEKVLLPLSRARAQSIKEALAMRGIEASRMTTEGVGASNQIVPDSDFANRWKNRRVEFFLKKKK